MQSKIKVSVIVPVYNVEIYLERCILSVKEQTLQEWELLIVDDGSQDNSAQIALDMMENDSRIEYYEVPHGGQGKARNFGVSMAQGTFVAFLDADDCLLPEALECLYETAMRENTDLLIFDHYILQSGKEPILDKLPLYLDGVSNVRERPDIFYKVQGAVWDKLFRRELLGGGVQKGHPYEDSEVLPYLLAKAGRIGQMRRPFYVYRSSRGDSTVNQSDTVFYIYDSLGELWERFQAIEERKLFQDSLRRYSNWLFFVAQNHVARNVRNGAAQEKYQVFLEQCRQLLEKNYPTQIRWNSIKIVVWGSYNLRCQVNRCFENLRSPVRHFGFSSIVSLMDEGNSRIQGITHENSFRAHMLQMDMEQTFRMLKKEEYEQIDYVCIDLLEERYSLAQIGNRRITYSDAFQEIDQKPSFIYKERDEEYIRQWEEAAQAFAVFLLKHFRPEQIILVENYLCSGYGEYGKEQNFPEQERLNAENEWLAYCYGALKKKLSGIKIIPLVRKELFFSDIGYPHGCAPWHGNEYWYGEVADQIIDYLNTVDKELKMIRGEKGEK